MCRTRRSFTTEYEVKAAHRVIDSGRTIAEVAREVSVNEGRDASMPNLSHPGMHNDQLSAA
jgi:hypothetical protein